MRIRAGEVVKASALCVGALFLAQFVAVRTAHARDWREHAVAVEQSGAPADLETTLKPPVPIALRIALPVLPAAAALARALERLNVVPARHVADRQAPHAQEHDGQVPDTRLTTNAAKNEMVTDRPDFTESSEVVDRGGFQFEGGFTFEGDAQDGVLARNISVPGALLRIGLGGRTELRIGADGLLSELTETERTTGYSDLELGVKIRLLNQETAGLDVAVIPMASFPTGASGFSSGGIDPVVKLTWARDLPVGFGATGNFNIASISDDDGRFSQRAVSVSIGHDLLAGWGGFIEAYAFTPINRGEPTGVTLDWGVSRPLGNNLQLDVEAGWGLTPTAPDWFIGFGVAVRGRVFGHR